MERPKSASIVHCAEPHPAVDFAAVSIRTETPTPHAPSQPLGRPSPPGLTPRVLLAALRPKQWSKNLIVFIGAVFALQLTEPGAVLRAGAAFVAFCLLSSAGYLFNDLLDIEADRQHPVKRNRPIASGLIARRRALALSLVLAAMGLTLALSLTPAFALVAGGYLGLTVLYSARLKHLVLIDLFVIAAGFVLRAVGGAVVVGVKVSPWLYVCTVLAALFLGLGKRRQELAALQATAGSHRRSLGEYTVELVDQLTTIVTAATIIAYSLYTFSAPNLPRNEAMMLTIPLVIYGLFRYLYLVRVQGEGGSPEELLLTDRPLFASAIGWAALSAAILYLA
jgi:4-hydroxybenzoate polyprenyltransferase